MDHHDDWLNMLVRRAAQEAVGGRQFKATLVCTGYKPQGHLVKGMIVPHGIESGWMQLAAIHAGNGFGIVIGPKVGDPKKMDGDQFDIDFDLGDPNTIVARHRMHSSQDVPPEAQSGEMILMHEKGHKLFFAQDGSVTIQHAAKMGVMMFDPSGNITHDAMGADITVQSMGGNVRINGTVTING